MRKRLKGKCKKLDKKGLKWQLIVNMGKNPETNKYDRKYATFYGNQRDADAQLRDWIAELEDEQERNIYSNELISEWLIYWFEDYAKAFYEWAQTTVTRNRALIKNNIIPYIGQIPLCELTSQNITDYYVYLGKLGKVIKRKNEAGKVTEYRSPLSKRTIKYCHVILNQSLNDAVKLNKIASNPATGLTPASEKKKPKDKWVVLNKSQLVEFLHKCEGHRDYALIYVAAYTGARQSELLGLEWDKVLWDSKELIIEQALHKDEESPTGFNLNPDTKNETSTRTIDISDKVIEVLKQVQKRQAENGLESNLIFIEPDGRPISRNNLASRYKNLSKQLGYKGMTFHHLRHTHATILLSDGVFINDVAARLGHADPRITFAIYGHVLPGKKQTLADLFDSIE